MKTTFFIAFAATAVAAVPTVPTVWTADVTATSNGTFPGVPKGTKSYTEYHDYDNKRKRLGKKSSPNTLALPPPMKNFI